MPPPDRMLTTIRRATELVRMTPGRTGAVVRLQECTEVLVVGDLHGHIANFQAVLKAADLGNHPTRHLVLQEVIHSKFRYPNGGDKSHQLVDLFAALRCQYPTRVHLLPGNHELAQWTDRPVGKADETLNELFREGIDAAYGPASADIYKAYCDLFKALPLALRTPNRVFISHSLPAAKHLPDFDPARLERGWFMDIDYQPGGLVYSLVWGRDTSERNVSDFLTKVDADLLVSGHIPTDEGYLVPNSRQLIVDCSESPAAYVLIPTDKPLTQKELLEGLVVF